VSRLTAAKQDSPGKEVLMGEVADLGRDFKQGVMALYQ